MNPEVIEFPDIENIEKRHNISIRCFGDSDKNIHKVNRVTITFYFFTDVKFGLVPSKEILDEIREDFKLKYPDFTVSYNIDNYIGELKREFKDDTL